MSERELLGSTLFAEVDLFKPDVAKVKVKSGTTQYQKTIKVEDLVCILKGCKEEPMKIEKMPRAPQGMVDLWYGQDTDFRVSIFVPGDLRPTAYLSAKNEKMLPYPNLLFMFKVEGGNISRSSVFAVKVSRARALQDDTKLYKFPYGNVWGDSGSICWGSNSGAVRHKSLSDMEGVIATFFNAVMNNDLYKPGGLNGGGTVTLNCSLEELLSKMSQEDVFPDKILMEAGVTYSKAMGM
jgi:hypothetical protein